MEEKDINQILTITIIIISFFKLIFETKLNDRRQDAVQFRHT